MHECCVLNSSEFSICRIVVPGHTFVCMLLQFTHRCRKVSPRIVQLTEDHLYT